jgi:DNA modification methylase
MGSQILIGDCRDVLRTLPDGSVHCIVTSPPYYGLRDYGVDGQIGLEQTPDDYVAQMVDVFREAKRALRDDGTLWLNIGDSYATGTTASRKATSTKGASVPASWAGRSQPERLGTPAGYKTKDLLMIPARVALALQADGWYLRSEIIWAKPNPMPESVRDRPTSAHEKVYLLAKSPRYFYDAAAVKEPTAPETAQRYAAGFKQWGKGQFLGSPTDKRGPKGVSVDQLAKRGETRNLRNVWTISPKPFKGAHFATFPPDLVEPCIKAGCPAGGTVLDPFGGSGTTGLVADRLGRNAILIELNAEYAAMAAERMNPMLRGPTPKPKQKRKAALLLPNGQADMFA